MSIPEARKRVGAPVPPAEATHWTLKKIIRVQSASGVRTRHERLTSPPTEGGQVPDTWPVADFSIQNVLALWGDGKYRIEWYDAGGKRLGGEMFEVAKPTVKSPRLKSARTLGEAPELVDAPAAAAAAGGGLGFMEIMTLLDRNTERAERREEAKAERDRQFMLQMQQNSVAMLNAIMQSKGSSGVGAESLSVLEQKLALQIERSIFGLERRLASQAAEEPDDPDDPDDQPADIGDAAERMVMSWLGQIEKNPELIAELWPKILSFLKTQGAQPSDELQARINAARAAAAANGRAQS